MDFIKLSPPDADKVFGYAVEQIKAGEWDRLKKEKTITTKEMRDLLCTAICQFAKRQETWFRGMEKKGVKVNWLPLEGSVEEKVKAATEIAAACGFDVTR